MAENQDQDREKKTPRVDSGDTSGRGRERRDDSDVYPAQRNAGDFGTHGGPNKNGKKDAGKPGPETQDV